MSNGAPQQDIARTTLAVLWIAALIVAAFWIVKPFLLATVWATMIVVATWPVMLRIEKLLWGKRKLAVVAMTVIIVLVFVIPVMAALSTLLANSDRIVDWIKSVNTLTMPPPPHWVGTIPLVGSKLSTLWNEIAAAGPGGLSARATPHAGKIVGWILSQIGGMGRMTLEFLLTVIIAGILYSTGNTAANGVLRFSRRLAGRHGEEVVILAAKSIRGVALGVVLTALLQALAGGIGLFVTGVPAASLLTAVMFMLCLAQIGPGLVLLPVVVWLFWSGHAAWGIFLTVWAIFVGTFDNFLRPVLIKKGADLPLLLIFPGVIGGLIALGIIGIFIGPVVLAVTYTLVQAWIKEGETRGSNPEIGEDPSPGEGKEGGRA